MHKYITEILQEISDDKKSIEKYKGNGALKILLHHAFDEDGKFILPKGKPPFTARSEPLGLTPTNFLQEMRRLYVFTRADLKPIKREALFIGMLEGIHESEAAVLIAVKDQKLHRLYRGVTRKLCEEYGLIKPKTKEQETDEE